MFEKNETDITNKINNTKMKITQQHKAANTPGKSETEKTTEPTKKLGIITNSAESNESQVNETLEESKTKVSEVKNENSQEELQAIVNKLIQPLKNSLDTLSEENKNLISTNQEQSIQLENANQKISDLEKQLNTANQNSKTLEDLGKLVGKSVSSESKQPLTIQGVGSPAMRTFEKHLNNAKSVVCYSPKVGRVTQRDLRASRAYWANNKQEISEGVEALMKERGFLNSVVTNAPTVITDIPHLAFEHLSNYIREATFDDLVHEQFFTRGIATGTDIGLNTAIETYPYFDRPDSVASRELTPGTPIHNVTDPLTAKRTTLEIKELGLGKDTNAKPIGLATFVNSFSMRNLEQIIEKRLGYDYKAYMDLRAYSLWFAATTVVYPKADGTLETASANLVAADGNVSREFFVNLHSYMKASRIATLAGGYYGFMHTPSSWAQYAAKLQTQERYVSDADVSFVSRMLMDENDGFGGEVSGFKGMHDGFFHFLTNSYGIGAAGTTGVEAITVESTATNFASAFAFGGETIGEATALPVEIRKNEVTDYQRLDSCIWYSQQGFADLNVNASATTGAEKRVLHVKVKQTISA